MEISSASTSNVTLSWLPASDDITPDAEIRYEVHASTDSAFVHGSATIKFSGLGQYAAQIKGLSAGTQYTARVVAIDGQGNATESDAHTVTTAMFDPTFSSDVMVHPVPPILPVTVKSNSVSLPTAQVADVHVGNFIVGSTEEGYLRKVTGITAQGVATELQTEPASLNNLFEDLQISSQISMESMPEVLSKSIEKMNTATGITHKVMAEQEIYGMQWPQSGLSMSSTDAAPRQRGSYWDHTGITGQLSKALSKPMTTNFEISNEQTIQTGKFAQVTSPAVVAVVGGNSGTFTVDIKILRDDQSFFGDPVPLTICDLKLDSIENPNGKTSGLVTVLPLKKVGLNATTGATTEAEGQVGIVSTKEQISPVMYKVRLRAHIDGWKIVAIIHLDGATGK